MTRGEFTRFQRAFYDEAHELMRRKNADYATGGEDDAEAFRNFNRIEQYYELGVSAEAATYARLLDKIARFARLISPGYEQQVTDESLRDTALDIANYASIIYGIVHEKRNILAHGRDEAFENLDDVGTTHDVFDESQAEFSKTDPD